MSRLLIGSSNVYRFHKLIASSVFKPYTMVCCTNQDVWNVSVDDIKMEKGEIIISVIENLICDAVLGVDNPDARKIIIEDVVGSFLAQIKKCAQDKPGIKIALAIPMLRPKHKWYEEGHASLCKFFSESIMAMGSQNVAKIDGSPVCTQIFERDGVHLTEAAGKIYVESLISGAEAFFTEEVIDLEKDVDMDDPEWIANRITVVEKEIGQLTKEIQERDRRAVDRRVQDSLVTARLREELDAISNAKKEDKLVITGLSSKTPMPTSSDEKRAWLHKIVGEILDKIIPESSKHVVFSSLGNRNSKIIPLVEVKMDSRDLAMKIRREFSAKKKADQDLGRIFIANSVTLATRVRIDILKAIAKKFSNDKEDLSVSAFVSRPVIHIRSKDGRTRYGTFNFSDALSKYGANLTINELGDAYKRAGAAFRGQLQQNFVVLNEQGAAGVPRVVADLRSAATGGATGSPRKRLREDGPSGSRTAPFQNKPKAVKKA